MSDKNFKVKNGLDANGAVTITQPSTSTVPLTILANTLATGSNLLEVKRPDGTVRLSVGNDGSFSAQNLVAYNVRFYSAQQGSQGLIIRGLPSQTANLQEWRDINETVLASVSASGSISAADLTLSGNLTVNGTTTNLNSTNLIIEDKNIIIADVATPTDTTADGAGITIKGTTDKTFSWINSTKSFTSSEPLIINNSSITTVPLVIKGYASQTANLTEWQNNSNQVVSSIRSNGGLSINYANSIRLFNTANTDYASLWMDNGSGGTNLYVKTNYPVLMGDVGVDTGASLTVATQGVSQVGQVIRGIASQSADLQQWQRSNGNPDLKVTNFGTLISGGGTTIASNPTINAYGAALVVNSGINTYPMVILKAASSQSANIQEWQNSAGTKVSTISPLGYLSINKSYTSYPLEVNGSLYAKDATAGSLYIQGGNNLIYPSILTGVGGNGWTSVTANYTAAPDGTTTATRYLWSSSGNCFILSSLTTNIANIFYTASIYVKPNNSTSRFIFSMRPGDSSDYANVEFDSSTNTASYSQKTPTSTFSNGTAGSIYVGNGWYRIWVTAKPTTVLSNFGGMFTTTQNNGDVNIWGAQLEKGYYASAYTPTTNAIVSNTNNLYVPSGDVYSASIQSIVSGTATLNTNGDTGAILINTAAAANKGLIVKGSVSQTANLQEWQNSNGSAISSVLSNGTFQDSATGFSAFGMFLFDSNAGILARGTTATKFYYNANDTILEPLGAAYKGLIIRGAASQTADLQQWQNSSGTVLSSISSAGSLNLGAGKLVSFSNGTVQKINLGYGGNYSIGVDDYTTVLTTDNNGFNGRVGIRPHDATYGTSYVSPVELYANGQIKQRLLYTTSVGLTIKAAASQTANLQEWQNSAGTVLSNIRPDGTIAAPYLDNPAASGSYLQVNAGTSIDIIARVVAQPTFRVRGVSGQTASLQQWQNSSGTVLANVDSSGNITDASNTAWLSPIGSGSNDAVAIQALIDAGKKEIRLGSGQWTFSTRIKVPNGVTIRGIGTSTTTTTGTRVNAVALIASEGTVRDITFTGAGENAQSELGGGGIAVLGGRVINCSVTDSRWVLAPTRQAHGYLKNFMSKMQGGYGSVKVAVLGDSLSENTSTTSWYGYLFNTATTATGYYLGSYFGHQIAPSEVDNMAIGGQGAYLLSAQLAMTKDTVRTGDYVNQVLDGDSVSTSPFFNRDYSLAILAIGQNGGEDWKAHLEYTVKSIRDKGIDVIILTQNPAAGAPTSRAGDEYFYRSMAETYGCLLVDTQAYFRLEVEFGRALGTTADLFGDGIHQSALGHQLYAKAILNGILDYDSTITVPSNPVVVSRSYIPAQVDRATSLPLTNAYYLVKKPDPSRGISGVTYTSATDSSIRNPIYGRGTTTNSVATLASGGYATWGVEYATAAYIIYRENSTANTLTVSLQGGTSTLATLSTGVTDGRTSIQKVVLSGYGVANRPIRITNTAGNPVQIYGVVFETHADVAFNRNTDGSYPGVKLNGSWAYSNLLNMVDYGSYLTPYTSTTNDSVTFKFYGDGLRFATSNGKNSGIIQVKIDDTTYTAVDTYYNIGEYGVFTHFYGGLQYGLHTATITLTGANAAVTGLISDGARFGLHRISAVRSEWYLTQDQQLAPNSDISAKVNSLSSPTIGSTGGANIATFYNGTNGYGAGSITSTGTFNINGANMGFPYTSTGATLNVNAGASSIVPLTVKGVSGQTASLQEWYNGAGQSIASISPYSEFSILGNSYFANAADYGARVNVSSSTASKIGIIIRGVASQTADLQQWQNSAGTTTFKIDTYGQTSSLSGFYATGGGGFGAAIVAQPGAATLPAIIAKGFTSQTASLQEWQNVSATVLAKVDSLGNFTATSKSFDIIHPTKENMRLRYGSLEGPENGVYIRGTAESNIIELPDYWTGLVHSDSITVSLTSVGSSQNIYVEKIENNKVYIGGNLEKAFFTVYGERKDIDKLTVEY